MQKTKRKENEDNAPIKNKKVKLTKTVDNAETTTKKDFKINKKDLKSENNNKDFKKKTDFSKNKDFKKKTDFSKNKKFNKFGNQSQNSENKKKFLPKSKDNSKFKSNSNTQQNGDKPVWSEMKKEKKQLRVVRRKAKSTAEVFELSHKAKLLAAQIQRKAVKQDFKLNSCKELHLLLKGQYKNIALTHDLSRVIQVLLKNGPDDIKNVITEEVMDIMVPMIQSKYAHHSVKRILKYGTDFIRHEVIKKFYGTIVSLTAHSISSAILDYAYGEFATKKEKQYMQQEFYGEIYKNAKDDSVKTLKDAYKDSPEMKTAILQACKANIQRIIDKNLHDGELFHSVLKDYLNECSPEESAELVTSLSPLIVPLTNSLPGADAACTCLWRASNKDKKNILKVVKEHVVTLSKHKTGYRLLLAIFDSVDDTVLVKKTIVATLAANIKDVAQNHWGNMTLHWLVKPRDSSAFHPSLIKFLEDGSKSGTSKKDSEIRVAELREAILPAIKTEIESDPQFWISDKTIMLLTVAVLSIESSKEISQALAGAICNPEWTVPRDGKNVSAIEDAAMHMCLKKLATLDKTKTENTLGEAFVDKLNDETLEHWLPTNRGCFFLLKLIESNEGNVAKALAKIIKPHKELLKKQSSQGARLLLQNIGNK